MIVTLIGKNVLYKTKLPKVAIGNYWITDQNDKKLISIEGNGENWEIISNNNAKILRPSSLKSSNISKIAQSKVYIINEVTLQEYGMYYVYLKDYTNEVFVLYCSPEYEESFTHLDIKTSQEILIGSGEQCDILYDIPLVKEVHSRIFFSNGKLMIENYDTDYGTFINNKPVDKIKMLFNGDIIFIMGLKIIIIGRSIYINNPFKSVRYSDDVFEINKNQVHIKDLEEDDDTEVQLYSEKDYFARAPRITNVIEREKIVIDSPPPSEDKETMPLILVLGSSLSMGVIMLMSMMSAIDNLNGGKATVKNTVFSILTSAIMLVSILLMPMFTRKWEKNQKIKNEKKRQTRYKEYINSKIELIDNIMKKQKDILYENDISAEECANIIINKGPRLWERKIEDKDFLNIRVGTGDLPLDADIEYPHIEFTMDDDNLVDILNTIVNKSKIIKDVPITISLFEKNIAALIVKNNARLVEKFMQNLIIQLVALHSYNDLKLVFLLEDDKTNKWEHMKTLPHIWDNSKQIRFWAENYDDMKEISRYLENEFINRVEEGKFEDKIVAPYYLIITDNYKKIENLQIINKILDTKTNIGFGIFCIADDLIDLPNGCQAFIELDGTNGTMFENEITSTTQKKFTFDDSYTFFFERIGKQLSSIPIKQALVSKNSLPESYTFLEMYDAGKIEQLNILERWKNANSTKTLQAPIGIDPSGMPIVLDIHEKAHGPHGLIAGSTGSGKSEFIKTYILSLAINYHPDDVTIIIIDYKGGDVAGAFQSNKIKLPHIVGTITNIDTAGLRRSLASIQSELRRRQILFNEAKNKIEEGNLDIYKYQKLYHEGVLKKPIPHLVIICDEFAELKQQQPDFMDELISVARIGRSLGVHLILATQKPAGIVDNQIRSNSKFGVCLRVQDKSDSIDVIKRGDAAELKKAGQFYLQVGNNEYFTLGLVGWSGAPYIPSDIIKKSYDNSIKFISDIGTIIKEVGKPKKHSSKNATDQLTSIVKYMAELAEREHIHAKPLWLEDIPAIIYINQLKKKYKVNSVKNVIAPVIGEYDDPYNQRQGVLELNLSTQGNTIIYGNADSGKETLLSTIIYDIMTSHTADEVQMYVLDFGSEALKIFKDSPTVGDVVFSSDSEKIDRLFEMVQKEIRERTEILSDYNGDYDLYISASKNTMPMIVVFINNYETFLEQYEAKYDEVFLSLTREGLKCGIVFIITANSANSIRYRLSHNFRQKIALQLNNQDDYYNIFEKVGNKRPANIFGRGLIQMEDIYEFQTAQICEPEKWNAHIKEVNAELNKTSKISAKPIPILPDIVTYEDIKVALKDLSSVPIGINKGNLEINAYNFRRDFINIITAKNIDIAIQFASNIIDEISQLKNVEVAVLDAESILTTGKDNLKANYMNFIQKLRDNSQKDNHIVCIIIGVDKFINELENAEKGLYEILERAELLANYNFIIVENVAKLKNHAYDEWYKNYAIGDSGIWVGNGIADQYTININLKDKNIVNRCGESFGYTIRRENATMVKLLGMKEYGDENG